MQSNLPVLVSETDTHTLSNVKGCLFRVPKFLQLEKALGAGAYGLVCAAVDLRDNANVAVKKIGRAFDDLRDCKRTLREIKMLRHFAGHENISDIREILCPQSLQDFDDIYIVSTRCDSDLHQIIKSPQTLSEEHVQYFIYQALCGLKYIHSANVLHRDLKPSNCLINADATLKICDFGMARADNLSLVPDTDAGYTEYVVTRWYRAPEVILNWSHYSKPIDVWSIGCIFAELYLREPLFAGVNHIDQVTKTLSIMGTPSNETLARLGSDDARQFVRGLGHIEAVPLSSILTSAPPIALDLIQAMLTLDPQQRITVDQALSHPYLSQFFDPSEELSCSSMFDFSFETMALDRHQYQCEVFREVLFYHPEAINIIPPDQQQLFNDANEPDFLRSPDSLTNNNDDDNMFDEF